MAVIKVNPTRMELTKLKKRVKTAQRGHKLLKDKRDEMVKQFLELVRKNRLLRAEIEDKLAEVNASFSIAGAVMSEQSLEEALCFPKQQVSLEASVNNIMSVNVPVFKYKMSSEESDIYPYGFAFTSGELDKAVGGLAEILPKLLELAQTEKSVMLLAEEIEKTRRRVNALEHVMIPNQQETIKYIVAKLDENDRSTTSRLMKVKDMMMK